MAGEEEVELRDLVAHTLETKGVLGKIRAQLRASVFLALEEQESKEKPHPLLGSSKFQQYLKTKEGQVATALVREFLGYFELDCTCSVFDPETNALETYPGRDRLANDLGLNDTATDGPLISQVLNRARSSSQPPPTSTAGPTPLITSSLPVSTAAAPLITASTSSSVRSPLDGNRQPISKHHTSSTPPSTHCHHEPHDSILQAGENNFMKPTNSSDKVESKGGGASTSEGTVTSNTSRDGGGSSGPPKTSSGNNLNLNGNTRNPSHLGTPTTNGMDGIGDSTGHLPNTKTGTALGGEQHRVNFTEEIEEDIPVSEDLSISEQNTDDFYGSKSSRGGSKGEYSYPDDFHSDDVSSKSESSKLQVASHKKYEETEDYTFSESSFGTDVDFVEPAKT